MLLSFLHITCRIRPTNHQDFYRYDYRSCGCRRATLCFKLRQRRKLLPLSSSVAVSAGIEITSVRREVDEVEFDLLSDGKAGAFNFGGSMELADLKRFESPTVEVKELDELPDQWRRSKLAWLCKNLPAHRLGTFLRVLNAQRKWIRQDDCTYVAVHCMRIRENEAAFRVYKWMVQQHWYRFDFALATKLADYIGKERNHLKCREIYDDIVNQGLIPTESTYHILIVAYLSSSGPDCLEEACSIYNQMIHLGAYKPRLSLHNSLFRALVSQTGELCKRHLKQAEFIFHNLASSGLRIHGDIYGGLIWLHSYQDVIDKERIASLRAELRSVGIKESKELLVSVLRACAKEGDIVESESTWTAIISSSDEPPSQAFLYMMEAYARGGKPMKSLEIFRNMQEHSSSIVSYYKIIQILCKAQVTELAESVMAEFVNSGLKPLTRSFIDMMDMYATLSLHDKVESTFFQCQVRCRPNQTAYYMYLESLVQSKNLQRAEEIFCQMHADEAIGVDGKACNTLLGGYLIGENHPKAKKIYEFMSDKKYEAEPALMEKLEKILSPSEEEVKMSVSPKLSKEQREVLIGLLLGGLLLQEDEEQRSYGIHFTFKENSKIHYFLKKHVYNQFHEWIAFRLLVGENEDIPCHFSTISHSCFQFYADQFWPQGLPAIPKLIHRWLTPRSLAYWYMYGGYRTASGDILVKLKFPKEDVLRIAKTLKARSLSCLVKRKGNVFWLGFLGKDAADFWNLVEPFVIADLKEYLEPLLQSSMESSEVRHMNLSSDSNTDENISEYCEDD